MHKELLEKLVKRCDDCDLFECINCEISWTEVQEIKKLIKRNKELEETVEKFNEQLDLDYVDNNFIEKDRIKRIIEELKKEVQQVYIQFLETNKTDARLHVKGIMLAGKIEILENLL